MVAGLLGPRAALAGRRSASPPPTTSAASALAAASSPATTVGGPRDGSDDATVDDEADELVELPLSGPDMRLGLPYQKLFGDVPLEDSVLRMFCQAAVVHGPLFGDNQSPGPMADAQAVRQAEEALFLCNVFQVLLGPACTSSLSSGSGAT